MQPDTRSQQPDTRSQQPDTFPRQKARTRGFQLGRPRHFVVTGDRVLFIRSSSGTDPVGSLWSIDPRTGREERVVDAAALLTDSRDLPPAERARRERMREVTSGITAFDTDDDGARAVFAVSGLPWLVDLATGAVRELPAPGPVIDPRIDPSGTRVAYVSAGALWTVQLPDGPPELACEPDGDEITWGLADFIAAEELERHRGHWWLGSDLLVERVDSTPVAVRWIGDPAQPEQEPVAHRYPQAGTANAHVELWRVRPDGSRAQLHWDTTGFPYLGSVHVHADRAVVIVLTRDQRRARILQVSGDNLEPMAERADEQWIDMMPGVPTLDPAGRLLEIVADRQVDAYRLIRDGQPLTPPQLQVRALLHADDATCLVLASPSPDTAAVYRISESGAEAVTEPTALASAVGDGAVIVVAQSSATEPVTTFSVRADDAAWPITSHAQQPLVRVEPHYATVGSRELRTTVLWPTGHVPGSGRLPVIMSPYGGPHAQRVVRSAMAYATEQWLADQGYAVVVADGRGTPGRGPAWERAIADDLAATVLQDQVDALIALGAQHPDLDLQRVGIRGWSFGGYLAALAVLDRPDVFHAAVAGAPVTDWVLYDTAYTERYLGHPDEHPDAYRRASLLERAHQLQRPLLMIHGLADDNVLAAHTLQLSGALLAAGRPHSVVPLSGVTHMTPQEVVAENLLRLEIDFFDSHLR